MLADLDDLVGQGLVDEVVLVGPVVEVDVEAVEGFALEPGLVGMGGGGDAADDVLQDLDAAADEPVVGGVGVRDGLRAAAESSMREGPPTS